MVIVFIDVYLAEMTGMGGDTVQRSYWVWEERGIGELVGSAVYLPVVPPSLSCFWGILDLWFGKIMIKQLVSLRNPFTTKKEYHTIVVWASEAYLLNKKILF